MEQVFDYVPLSGGVRATFLGLIGVLLALPAMFIWMYIGIASARVGVGPSGLALRAPWYGRTIPLAELRVGDAEIVSLRERGPHVPNLRTNGLGLPGLQVGWFRLVSGERALAFLTARDRVVYVPTHAGYALLVSVERPEAFLAALEAG